MMKRVLYLMALITREEQVPHTMFLCDKNDDFDATIILEKG